MAPSDHIDWSAIVTTIATSLTTIAVALIERGKHRRRRRNPGLRVKDARTAKWSRNRRDKPKRQH